MRKCWLKLIIAEAVDLVWVCGMQDSALCRLAVSLLEGCKPGRLWFFFIRFTGWFALGLVVLSTRIAALVFDGLVELDLSLRL